MKHDWEPVDNQGYTMRCVRCGAYISMESSDWDKEIDADCPEANSRGNRAKLNLYEDMMCESCIHKRVCRFEVPVGTKCGDYIKEEM